MGIWISGRSGFESVRISIGSISEREKMRFISERWSGVGFVSGSVIWVDSGRWVGIWIYSHSGLPAVRRTIRGVSDAEKIHPRLEA